MVIRNPQLTGIVEAHLAQIGHGTDQITLARPGANSWRRRPAISSMMDRT